MMGNLLLIIGVLVTAALSVWMAAAGAAGVSTLSALADWCRSFVSTCASITPFISSAGAIIGALLLACGTVYAVVNAATGFIRVESALRKNKLKGTGNIRIIKNDAAQMAFTYGIINPKIYVSSGLFRSLGRKELNLIVLHEAGHLKAKDPLKFLIARFATDVFFFIPALRRLECSLRHRSELEADKYAAQRSGDPIGLSEAIVKYARMVGVGSERGLKTAGFGGEFVENRVRRLLGYEEKITALPFRIKLVSAFAACAFILTVAFTVTLPAKAESCAHSHCTKHNHAAEASCKTHCEKH